MTQEKREKIRELQKMIKGMSNEQRLTLCEKVGIVNIEGKGLSVYNQCLLMMQRESVSVVGGFVQWKKAGRYVKAGEESLVIWFPCAQKKAEDAEEEEETETRFMLGNVFDISQTEENQAAQN